MKRPFLIDPALCEANDDRNMKIASSSSSTTTASDASSPGSLVLQRTITERYGGKQMWISTPNYHGLLMKKGFRWRKLWKQRYVSLNGRELTYSTNCKYQRGRIVLSERSCLEDNGGLEFTLFPDKKDQPWRFRASSMKEKHDWMMQFTTCIDALCWLQHYSFGKKLGEGGHGSVSELVDKRTNEKYAVKVITVRNARVRAAVVSEVNVLQYATKEIQHPNLATVYKVYEEGNNVYIVMKICTGGELYDRIVEKGRFEEMEARRLFRKLLSAIEALHSHNILHLDIKPENIMFETADPDAELILTDFGVARHLDEETPYVPLNTGRRSNWCNPLGTVGYMAPEIILERKYTKQADVFSLGVLLFIFLVGQTPFNGRSELDTLKRTTLGNYMMNPDDWEDVSQDAIDLVRRMLLVNPDERIAMDEILTHPWLSTPL